MATALRALNELIAQFLELGHQINSNTALIHSIHFDYGIVKLQMEREYDLMIWKKCCVSFLNQYQIADTNVHNEEKDDEIAPRLQREIERERLSAMRKLHYVSTYHVLPISVIYQSLFSIGKYIITPQRRHMDPSTFEMIMILSKIEDFLMLCL